MNARPLLMGFRLADENPGHVRVQLFSGRNVGARGNLGTITERTADWSELRAALLRGGFEEMPALATPAAASCQVCGREQDAVWDAEDGTPQTWARHDCELLNDEEPYTRGRHYDFGCHSFAPAGGTLKPTEHTTYADADQQRPNPNTGVRTPQGGKGDGLLDQQEGR